MRKLILLFAITITGINIVRGQTKTITLIIDTLSVEPSNEENDFFIFNAYASKNTYCLFNPTDTNHVKMNRFPNYTKKLLISGDSVHIIMPLDKENSFCILMNPCHFPGDTIRISSYKVFNNISLDSARYDHFSYNTRKGAGKTKQSHIISKVIHDTIPFDSVTITINGIKKTTPLMINYNEKKLSVLHTTIHKHWKNYCYNKSSIIYGRKIEINLDDFH